MDKQKRVWIISIIAGSAILVLLVFLGLVKVSQWLISKTTTPEATSTATLFSFPATWTEAATTEATPIPRRLVTQPLPTSTRPKLIMPTQPGSLYIQLPTETPTEKTTPIDTPTLIKLILHSPTATPTFSSRPAASETP